MIHIFRKFVATKKASSLLYVSLRYKGIGYDPFSMIYIICEPEPIDHGEPYLSFTPGHLFVTDGSTPDAETECQLVDQISNVVHNVDDALLVVSGGGPKEGEVVSKRIDAPTDGDDQTQSLKSLLAGLVARSTANLRALSREHFVDESQPTDDTWNESAEDGDNSGLTSPTASQHEDGLSEKSVEECVAQVWHDGLQDQVEFDDLKRDGDEPISVSVDCRRRLRQHPGFTHVAIVPECNSCDETSNSDRCAPFLWDS